MATNQSFVDFVLEQADLGSRLHYKKMFGEYGLYIDEKIVALACDDSLLIKPNPAAAQRLPAAPQRAPYPGAKPYLVIDELLDEPERLRDLLLESAKVLPATKKKTKTNKKTSR